MEALIDATLVQLAETGFEADMLEAAVNSIEFNLRENNTGSTPRRAGTLHALPASLARRW